MERTRRIPIARGSPRERAPLHVARRLRPGPAPRAEPRVSLESVGASWWSALDAAETALRATGSPLKPEELRQRAGRLVAERAATVELLDEVARAERVRARFSQLLLSRSKLRVLLGLPADVHACVFSLDGVLIGSAALHAAAWAETFDELILARIERTGGKFAPFDPWTDYAEHIHGKPRLDGVRAFLAGRGISLPDGTADDPPGAETVYGLANRKREALLRRLEEDGVTPFEGSRRYLETARDAGLRRAVVSASANTERILERAGLASLIEQRVDGSTILAEGLRARPAADIMLAACRLLGVEPGEAAAFETSPAGVAAARAAGVRFVVGVDRDGRGDRLLAEGADLAIGGLAELFERKLAAPR